MLLTLTHKWVGQAPPKKVKMMPKMILHRQELGNDAKHISEVGFLMATQCPRIYENSVTAQRRASEGSELPGSGGIQAEVGQPLSEMKWKGSRLISHLFTQPTIPKQVRAGTCVIKIHKGSLPVRETRNCVQGLLGPWA